MSRKKKILIQTVMVFCISSCVLFAIPKEVKAEKKESPELAELLGWNTCYDCGSKTEDGVLEFKSDSHSLKEGDIVELQMIYNADMDNVTGGLSIWEFSVTHDLDVLEYLGVEMKDEYKIKYMPSIYTDDEEGNLWNIFVNFNQKRSEGVEENGCLLTVRYKVRKTVSTTKLYIDKVGYGNAEKFPDIVQLYDEAGDANVSDVFTVNIEDSIPGAALSLSSAPVQGSGEIIIPISIEKNDGFNLLGLTLDYDPAIFTYESLEIDDKLKSKISLDSIYEAPGSGKIKASFIALDDITDTGDFLNLKLKVRDEVSAGTTSNVGVDITQVGNKAETAMSGTGTNCAVNIIGSGSGEEEQQPVLGDVNADKNIDLVDAVYILQNYNQVREFTKIQETAADVDKNGTVNLLDALMIMKFFNGEITGF